MPLLPPRWPPRWPWAGQLFPSRRCLPVAIAALCLLLVAGVRADDGVQADAEPAGTRAEAAKIEKLIADLGAEQFARRETAQAALKQMGLVAFDALLEAQRHPDIEIALRARYLVRSLPIRWSRANDPRRVKGLLATYAEANRADRLNRMQELAGMSESAGIPALCRLVRFETDYLLSKQAALLAISHVTTDDKVSRQELAEKIRTAIGQSNRTGADWMLTYAQTLENGEETLAQWQEIVDTEVDNLARFPDYTDRNIVRDLLRWHAELLRQLGHDEAAMVAIQRTLDLMEDDREEIIDIVDWSLEREAWSVIDEVAMRFPIEFNKEVGLIYRLAEAQRKRGDEQLATQTAARARAMHPKILERHVETALILMYRQMYDWSEAEYRFVIESQETENRDTLHSHYALADMLFDLEQLKEAAAEAQAALDAITKDARLLQQSQRRTAAGVRGTAEYYQAMYYASVGDTAKQMEFLEKAIASVPSHPDYLIAMYRVKDADQKWRDDTRQKIEQSANRLRDVIRLAEHTARNPRLEDLDSAGEPYNEFAWLISNTEGDYREALRASLKSLELEPGNGAYLDTLGRCYYAVGDLKNAVKTQKMAVEKAPYYQQIRRQLKFFQEELARQEATQDADQPVPPADASNG